MRFYLILLAIVANIFLYSYLGFAKNRAIIPVPFYTAETRGGVSLKYVEGLDELNKLDFLLFATQNRQFAIMSQYIFSPSFFSFKLSNALFYFQQDYFGVGNQLPISPIGKYTKSRIMPEASIDIPIFSKYFGITGGLRYNKTIFSAIEIFDDTDIPSNHVRALEAYYGLKIKIFNGKDKQLIEAEVSNISSIMSASNVHYNKFLARLKKWTYFTEDFHHAFMLDYRNKSNKLAFYDTERSKIRGIDGDRINDRIALRMANELHHRIIGDLGIVLFADLGRVYPAINSYNLRHDLHFGYGAGLRYNVKNLTTIRFDYGMSANNETSITFSYGKSI